MTRKTGRSHRLKLHGRGNTACPLCFTPFTRAEASSGRTVTLEHVPPKALGGRALCLTCKSCNSAAGREADQMAAMNARSRFPVTVDILGKKDSFMLSLQGKELTPPFRGFTKEDLDRLDRSGGQFTMSIRLAAPHLVAASAIKSAYLALFSLFGSTVGYDYVEGRALAEARRLVLEPVRYARKETRKYVCSLPEDGMFATEGQSDPDIMLVTEPHACWIVRVHDRLVFLPSDRNGAESAPFSDWYIENLGCRLVHMRVAASWMFQEFGTSRAVPVRLPGAETHDSLFGRSISGTLPDGNRLKGVCVNLEGEDAVLLCDA